jgi:hypothetical protein
MFESNQLNILRRRFSRLHLQQPGLGNALGRSTHCPGRIETQTASHYVDRYSKNHREEQVASWPHAGLVHANLWTGFSKFLQTLLDYKVNDLGVARSGTDHCTSGWVAAIVRSGKKTTWT